MNDGRSGGFGGEFMWPRLTPAVKVLMIANAVVFVVNAVVQGQLAGWFGVSWSSLWEGFGLGLLRLGTYQFVHDFISPLHILFNMLMLYFFGTFVEEAIGRVRLYRLYLLGGLLGGIMHVLVALAAGGTGPMVGASGAIYAIMVYAAFMAPHRKVIFIVFPIELRWLVGVLVGMGAYSLYVEFAVGAHSRVAHGGHLGGALWGFLAFRLSNRRWRWLERVQNWQSDRDQRTRRERQEVLDRLLEKVHEHGIGALTAAERRFLDKTSQDMRRM